MDRRDEAAAALEPSTFELSLGDGRTLTYCLYGPDEGSPVLFHYGTLASGCSRRRRSAPPCAAVSAFWSWIVPATGGRTARGRQAGTC